MGPENETPVGDSLAVTVHLSDVTVSISDYDHSDHTTFISGMLSRIDITVTLVMVFNADVVH